ncbi:BRCT domain containing protein [Cryptosporidium felis]|nr:BRCT domain containing protein [Cryptosporidium felis]
MKKDLWGNKRFLLSGFEKEESRLIKEKYIEEYGGIVLEVSDNVRDEDVDYLICNYSKGYRYRKLNIDYQKLRTPFWIWLSVNDHWNYSLSWHPFFRPNGHFTCGLLSDFQINLVGYSRTRKGFEDRECPKYIRKVNDVGILASFITTQMGGELVSEEVYQKDSSPGKNTVKLILVCGEDEEAVSKSDQKGHQMVKLSWLYECYEEGRILNYKKYAYYLEKKGMEIDGLKYDLNRTLSQSTDKEDADSVYRVLISHQVYLKHAELYEIVKKIASHLEIVVGRPSKEILRYFRENGDIVDNLTIILVLNGPMEEQDFWYDLLNKLNEDMVTNLKFASKEKKVQFQGLLQRLILSSEPEELITTARAMEPGIKEINELGKKVGSCIPSYIKELLSTETEILDTILKSTDFGHVTGLSDFVEYSNDNLQDIIHLNRSRAIKRLDNFENEYLSNKFVK